MKPSARQIDVDVWSRGSGEEQTDKHAASLEQSRRGQSKRFIKYIHEINLHWRCLNKYFLMCYVHSANNVGVGGNMLFYFHLYDLCLSLLSPTAE